MSLAMAVREHLYTGELLLIHSCLDIFVPVSSGPIIFFENNFGIKHKFTNYFKESCWCSSDQHFYLNV